MTTDPEQKNISGKTLSFGNRIAELSLGLITNKALDSIFNYLLYPFVIFKFGILKGGVVRDIKEFTKSED